MDITSYLLGKNAGGGDLNLQNKSITITENTTTTINPDSGYDGLNKVEVTTNVSGGGGVKTIYEINALNESMANDFNNYFANLPNNYKILTTDSVTLYTPGDPTEYKYYLIQKRPSGNYRIVWCKSPRMLNGINIFPLLISWEVQYLGTPIERYYKINILDATAKDFVYVSSEFTTIEECIQKLKSNATTYTTMTNFLAYTADTPDIIPYSNVSIYFSNHYDATDEYFITSSTRISSNENIVGI